MTMCSGALDPAHYGPGQDEGEASVHCTGFASERDQLVIDRPESDIVSSCDRAEMACRADFSHDGHNNDQRPQQLEVGNLSQVPDRDSIPEQALFVKLQWCKLILHQNKTWEVRGSRTHKRGRFCLAASQTNMLLGEARLVDCIRIAVRSSVDNSLLPPPENPENFLLRKENWSKHLIADIGILADYKEVWAWVLKDVKGYSPPMPWRPKHGAVRWAAVRLSGPAPGDKNDEPASKKPRLQICKA